MFRNVILSALALTIVIGIQDSAQGRIAQPKDKVAGKGTPVNPVMKWTGSVDDEALTKLAPTNGLITDEKTFEKIWTDWKVGDKAAKIDWSKHLAVVATARGSKLTLSAQLDDKGNLTTQALGTRDLRPGFRYDLQLLSREGIKSVNGKELK